jgi:hypothetical protein
VRFRKKIVETIFFLHFWKQISHKNENAAKISFLSFLSLEIQPPSDTPLTTIFNLKKKILVYNLKTKKLSQKNNVWENFAGLGFNVQISDFSYHANLRKTELIFIINMS